MPQRHPTHTGEIQVGAHIMQTGPEHPLNHSPALIMAMLEHQPAAGPEPAGGLVDQPIDHGQALRPGAKRRLGFETQIALFQVRIVGSHVRRIADDGVERLVLDRAEQVALKQAHRLQSQALCIAGADFQGGGRDVDGRDLPVGPFRGQGEGNTAGAGANIHDPAVALREPAQSQIDEQFGFRAWNQHRRRDEEVASVEFPRPGNIGNRFPPLAAPDQALESRALIGIQVIVGMRVQPGPFPTQTVPHEELGFQPAGDSRGRRLHGIHDGDHRFTSLPMLALAVEFNGLEGLGMDMSRFNRCISVIFLTAWSATVVPSEAVLSVDEQLEPGEVEDRVRVTSTRMERELLQVPAAVSQVSEESLQTARQQLQLDETLNRVPGLFFQNRYNFAQNLRLAIRGFGARSPFGIRGIRLLVDGFPETLPDGQAQVDAIDLEAMVAAEVLRGPSSALHGNASGGVISLRTEDGRARPPELEARASLGSHGFERYGVRAGGQFDEWNAYLSAWDLRYDGYREQSRTEKRLFNAHLGRELGPDRRLGLVLTLLDQPLGQDPAALTREAAERDRRTAGGQAAQVNARQEVEQYRLGLRYEDAALLAGELSAYGFLAGRDFFQQLPSFFFPSLIEFDRRFFGGGLQYLDELVVGGLPGRYTLGVDLARQRDDRRRFRVTPTGARSDQTQDELQRADNAGLFGQVELVLSERWSALAGLRYDRVRLDIDDRFGERLGSGSRTFEEWSWTAGANYRVSPEHQIYASAGTAFETPTFTEIKDAAGGVGFSRDLEPQLSRNLEIGFRGRWAERFGLDLALFRIHTRDEIIVVASEDGLNLFDNAGRTRREGLELALDFEIRPGLDLAAAYTWSRYRFDEFRDAGQRFDGNRMPGLPEHALFAELAWRKDSGWYGMIDTLLVGHVYADNANRERVSGYGLVNLRAGREFASRRIRVDAFLALNNLSDRDYFSNVRVNANNAAYFEPAPERNLFAGLRVRLAGP